MPSEIKSKTGTEEGDVVRTDFERSKIDSGVTAVVVRDNGGVEENAEKLSPLLTEGNKKLTKNKSRKDNNNKNGSMLSNGDVVESVINDDDVVILSSAVEKKSADNSNQQSPTFPPTQCSDMVLKQHHSSTVPDTITDSSTVPDTITDSSTVPDTITDSTNRLEMAPSAAENGKGASSVSNARKKMTKVSSTPPGSGRKRGARHRKKTTTTTTTDTTDHKQQHSSKSRKSKVEEQSCKLTDFFPVRRSGRRTKNDLLLQQKKELEEILLSDKDPDYLKVVDIQGKGRGVVTETMFNRGDFIVEYAGDLVNLNSAKERETNYSQKPDLYGCYMYYFTHKNKSYCIDATLESGRLGRLINHSKTENNCLTKLFVINDTPYLTLVAKRLIRPGEELLYDYGDRSRESVDAHPWLAK